MLTRHKITNKLNFANICHILKNTELFVVAYGEKYLRFSSRVSEAGTDQKSNMKWLEMLVKALIHETNKT